MLLRDFGLRVVTCSFMVLVSHTESLPDLRVESGPLGPALFLPWAEDTKDAPFGLQDKDTTL